MKKTIALLLCCAMLACMLSGCSSSRTVPAPTTEPMNQTGVFVPETTAVATGGFAQALASVGGDDAGGVDPDIIEQLTIIAESADEQNAAEDVPAEDSSDANAPADEAAPQPTAAPEVSTTLSAPAKPLATATPQPNTAISSYTEIGGAGLGFRFSYPTGWQNVPGRSTVCYLQPVTDGTLYPARVSVSMKQLYHKCNMTLLEEQMVDFVKTIMSQYDESTFQVDDKLDIDTKFMGNTKTLATSYLAYDGEQEIEGYVIMTYFERYVFAFHFVCAYEDYETFGPAMRRMRDSVQADQNEMVHEDDD